MKHRVTTSKGYESADRLPGVLVNAWLILFILDDSWSDADAVSLPLGVNIQTILDASVMVTEMSGMLIQME